MCSNNHIPVAAGSTKINAEKMKTSCTTIHDIENKRGQAFPSSKAPLLVKQLWYPKVYKKESEPCASGVHCYNIRSICGNIAAQEAGRSIRTPACRGQEATSCRMHLKKTGRSFATPSDDLMASSLYLQTPTDFKECLPP